MGEVRRIILPPVRGVSVPPIVVGVQVPDGGAEGEFLTRDSGDLAWATPPAADPADVQAAVDAAVPGAVETALDAHRAEATPHDAYDLDMPSLTILYQNGLI